MTDKDMTTGNGPYALGGFVGKGKRHKGGHRAPSLLARLLAWAR